MYVKEFRLTGYLQVPSFVNEQILRFQISVQDTVGMAEVQAFDELICEFLDVSAGSG